MFKDLKLGTKLTGGYLIVASLIVMVALLGYTRMKKINDSMTDMYQNNLVCIRQLGEARTAVMTIRGDLYQFVFFPDKRSSMEKDFIEQCRIVNEQMKQYSATDLIKEEKEEYANFQPAWLSYQKYGDEMITKIKAGDEKAYLDYLGGTTETARARQAMTTSLAKLVEINEREADKANTDGDVTFASSSKLMLVGTIFGIALAIGLGLLISRGIARRILQVVERAGTLRNICIKNLKNAMEAMASGNIKAEIKTGTTPLEDNSKDELGVLAQSINGMLSQTVGSIEAFRNVQKILQGLLDETDRLIAAAKEGRLDVRGDVVKLEGSFRELVAGINATLDAVIDPIQEASGVLEKVSAKDLSVRVAGDYRGDHAKIKNALNSAVENLDEALTQVALGAEQVTSAATQISSGSQELSHSASEQAASLEETSSSLQELSSMASQNAANAREAKGLTEAATASTEQGVQVMKELNGSIVKIKASSDATAKIVKTIDEIAFQTNLLALNAAVEAARAGDAGKGFAVVAEEVRNLAIRSAEAAKNTANLIDESVKNAEDGVRTNQKMLAGLNEITGQVKKVSEVMAEIAVASDQQKDGVNQINKAIEQMNQVTQAVAANAEESASAAEELSGQSTEMMSMVESFRLSAGKNIQHSKTSAIAKTAKSIQAAKGKSNGNGQKALAPAALIPFHEDEQTMSDF